jgi:uncharacterized protein YkuJ
MKKVFTFTILLLSITVMSFAHSRNPEKMKPDDFRNIFLNIQKINQFNKLKSVEVNKQRLDSIVAEAGAKYSYTYNSDGNLILDVTYSSNGSTWKGENKVEYSYDLDGMMIQEKDYEWDEDKNNWVPTALIDVSYDSGQKPITIIMSQWDLDLDEWKKLFKSDIIYNADDNQQQLTLFMWDGVSEWTEAGGTEMTYDTNGNLIEEISELFGIKNKTVHTYDTYQNEVMQVMYDWDAATSSFVESEKIEYPYDAQENQTIDITYNWDTNNSKWIKTEKTERRYDANGNMSQESHSMWDQSGSSWVNSTKEEYICDKNYDLSDLILPPDNEIYTNQIHMVTKVKYYSWNSSSSDWILGGESIAHYSEHDMTFAAELNGAVIKIYPNPVSDFVTVDLQQISNPVQFELFDMQGHEIMSREIMNTENISLKGLSEGLYFYNLSSGKERISGKIIKQ